MGMPLDQAPRGGDGDHDAGPRPGSEIPSHVLGEGLGSTLREVEEQLPALSEDPAQQTGHGEDEMAVRDGREDLVVQPLGPQELLLLLA